MVIDPLTGERACDRCTNAVMVKIQSKAGLVEICWTCTLASMPDKDSTWLEERHREFSDHLADKMRAAAEREKAANDKAWAEEAARRLRTP